MTNHFKTNMRAVLVAVALSAIVHAAPAYACTVGESVRIPLPLNGVNIAAADRLKIAVAVIEARKWPDVDIQAVVISGAYTEERNGEYLKEARANVATTYLQQLGIKSENIIVDKMTFTDDMVRKRDGTLDLYQVDIELTPYATTDAKNSVTILA